MNAQTEASHLSKKRQEVFFIALLTLIIIGYFYTLYDEITMLKRVYEDTALLKIRTSVIPLIMMMPALAVLIWGIGCRLVDKVSERSQKNGLFIIIGCFPLFLIGWAIYSWQVMNWLDDNGYTQCSSYSGVTMGAPKIMVNNPSFCIEDGYQVRIELLDWFEEQYLQGVTPTVEMVSDKQEKLLSNYNERFDLL
ncbi:hypothetical protein KO527_18540 [Pseudoalteromonas sp. C2R02]|uniref:hypothetical protein n=1 Tax=Pseudoalteromonas sp. C2R02 TaxID=2841565 RepID=UPI001C08CAFC|nr:hypothetical protein [Pseudoalteromonas sp. C2R02]MBU2971344.1 hypothetical protein [Pseudoalteromonas sp. C2R02]